MNCTLENSKGCGTGCMSLTSTNNCTFLCGHIGGVSHLLCSQYGRHVLCYMLDYDLDIEKVRETNSCKLLMVVAIELLFSTHEAWPTFTYVFICRRKSSSYPGTNSMPTSYILVPDC